MELFQKNALVVIAVMGSAAILSKFAMWTQEVNSDLDTFKGFVKKIREKIKMAHSKIDKTIGRLDNAEVSGGSPLHLAELRGEARNGIQARQPADTAAAGFVKGLPENSHAEFRNSAFVMSGSGMSQTLNCRRRLERPPMKTGSTRTVCRTFRLSIELRDALIRLVERAK